MKYKLRQRAREDLELIWHTTIQRWGLNKAEEYLSEVLNALEKLADNPKIGIPRPELDHDFHSFVVGRHTIYYCRESECVNVIRILHQRMDAISRISPNKN